MSLYFGVLGAMMRVKNAVRGRNNDSMIQFTVVKIQLTLCINCAFLVNITEI